MATLLLSGLPVIIYKYGQSWNLLGLPEGECMTASHLAIGLHCNGSLKKKKGRKKKEGKKGLNSFPQIPIKSVSARARACVCA